MRADKELPEERLVRFTKLVEQGLSIPDIADRMGIGKGAAYALRMKMRARQEKTNHG